MRLIIETDFFDDVDDVGALALAHALADQQDAEIVAVCVNTRSRWGPLAVRAVNDFFGRPDIPVGALYPIDDSEAVHDYARLIVERYGNPAWDETIPDAATLTRTILEQADERSIAIVSIGFFGNLVKVLRSTGASGTGRELVRRAVAKTIVMGGAFPAGSEYNFTAEPALTQEFFATWPTPITLLGWEVGVGVITGRMLSSARGDDPISLAYRSYCGEGEGRESWDPLAVFLAVFGEKNGFVASEPGEVTVDDDGKNTWTPLSSGRHRYIYELRDREGAAREMDTRIREAIDRRRARIG